MQSKPKRTHPDVPSAENGELVATSEEEIEKSRREAGEHDRDNKPTDDALGMRAEPSGHNE